MWFKDQNGELGGIYWLTHPDERDAYALPERVPDEAPLRSTMEGDWVWDFFVGVTSTGARVRYAWVTNPDFLEVVGELAKIEFPKIVTMQTLADFFKKSSQKIVTIKLNDFTNISRNGDYSHFVLAVQGRKVIAWDTNKVHWCAPRTLTPTMLDALRNYLGKTWKLTPKDGLVGLQNEAGDWFLAHEFAAFTIDGRQTDPNFAKTIQNPALASYNRLLDSIRQYVGLVTPDRIKKISEGMSPATHAITTRCNECQACNGIHLEIHMAREELDPYLIYSAYDAFGPVQFGGALRQTWDLLANPSSENITAFKSFLESFLLDTLRTKVNNAYFMPSERREGSNPWKIYNKTKLQVDGGVRLISNREGEVILRDGEYLAQEVGNRPRLQLPRVAAANDWGFMADELVRPRARPVHFNEAFNIEED